MSKLTEVLAQHRVCLEPTGWPFPRPVHRWSCPFRTLDPECEWGWAEHDRFVEEAIAAAGLAVIELADAETVDDCGLYYSGSFLGLSVAEENSKDGTVRFRSIEDAQRYAAALLSVAATARAANAAEAVSK